ncbi:MAG: hypothetical protein ACTSXK_02285 [Promethearchaeota archaeon]
MINKSTTLNRKEKMALAKLLVSNKLRDRASIEFEIEKGHIIYLRIYWMDIKDKMEMICFFPYLEKLIIRNCKIGSLPAEFALLTNLSSLTISFFNMRKFYEIENLFPTLFFLPKLKELVLEYVVFDSDTSNNNIKNFQKNFIKIFL